jgi:hypothetical protein
LPFAHGGFPEDIHFAVAMTGHFPASRGPLSDWECRHAQTCASKAPQTSRPSRTPQGRVGDRASPLPEPFPFFSGLGVPVPTQPRLFLSRQRKKRRGPHHSRSPCPPRPPSLPSRGKSGETPHLRPVPHAIEPSANARCRSLPISMRPARTNPPQAAIEKYLTWRIRRTGERFRKPPSTAFSEWVNS